ncbi:MAG: response regulator [Pyrinomonadaceae bacterium]
MEIFIKLVDALSKIAWPALAAIVLWKLYPALKNIMEARGFSVELGGMKLSVQEASDQLRKQIQDLQEKIGTLQESVPASAEITPESVQVADNDQRPKRILWVDDVPSNNAYEIAKLRDDGFEITQAVSTTEAMNILTGGKQRFGLIISDMGRKEEGEYRAKAGLKLIKAIDNAGLSLPVIVYSSANYAARNRHEVLEAGGYEVTASPTDLYELIKKVMGDS